MNNKRTKTSARTVAPRLRESVGPVLNELVRRLSPPEEVQRHFRTARMEVLKGLRAIIDARLAHLSSRGGGARKGEKIEVE